MFKWPGTPSVHAPTYELADYAELACWKQNSMSTTELSADLGRLEENDYSDGVPEEEETPCIVNETYTEIVRREEACRNGYPFEIPRPGYTLLLADQDAGNQRHSIYKYLLLATRLNMQNNRVHGGIDGTLLFEELAAETAREYLGARAESLVFGTASGADFQGKVNALCKQMKEGVCFVNRDSVPPNERDGKLDVVVWKHFADGLPGKLVAFGQCKTGTNYKDTLTQLQPDSFCRKWLTSAPVVPPVRMFFVSEALSRNRWHSFANDAGLLFDRCRIVDFCGDISPDVLEKVKIWTAAAAEETELPAR